MMKTKNSIYLTDNYWKRTLGYWVVAIISLLFGCGVSIYLNDVNIYQIPYDIKGNWISIAYIILTVALFIAGFVSLYIQRSINKGYKFIVVLDCIFFVAMIYFFLNFFRENDFFFLLFLYGTLSLSAMIFYYRLSEDQFEFVRYELVWPAIYTIALSAYMGYALILYLGGKGDDSLVFPILVLLIYEYVLFLSDIPKVTEQKNKIGFVHIIFLVLILGSALWVDSCKIAVYFLLFCSASIILEALDVIMRKESDSVKEKYDSAMCLAISVLSFMGSVVVIFMERIPLTQAILLVAIFEVYGIIFYNVRKIKNCTGVMIDITKLVSFMASIIAVFSLFFLSQKGIDLVGVLKEQIDFSIIKTWFMTILSFIIVFLEVCGKDIKDWILKKTRNRTFFPLKVWQECKLSQLYLYLGVANVGGQIILQFGAKRKSDRVEFGTLILFIIFFINLGLYTIEYYNKDSDHGKEKNSEEKNPV